MPQRIHFVYAGDPNDGRVQSPYTITKNVHRFLSQRAEVIYHQWDARHDIDLRPDDIFIGHPHYDTGTVVQKVFRSGQTCKLLATIHPFHHRRTGDNAPFHDLSRRADKIFSICGPYWYDTAQDTEFAFWKPKMVRLDMAVDSDYWQHVKKTFNPPGKRGILFVGSSMPQKNLTMLTRIAEQMQDVKFEWYGGSSDHPLFRLPNVHVEGWQHFSQEKIRDICSRNDIFVNTSISDANPTTLLEFCLASGIIPICTKESGYVENESFINIPLLDSYKQRDMDNVCNTIRTWLNKPSDELIERSVKNRAICETQYTWDRFCNTIWDAIRDFVSTD